MGERTGEEEGAFAYPGEAVCSPGDDCLELLGSLKRGSCWEEHSSQTTVCLSPSA